MMDIKLRNELVDFIGRELKKLDEKKLAHSSREDTFEKCKICNESSRLIKEIQSIIAHNTFARATVEKESSSS